MWVPPSYIPVCGGVIEGKHLPQRQNNLATAGLEYTTFGMGVMTVAHPHIPFQCECPPPSGYIPACGGVIEGQHIPQRQNNLATARLECTTFGVGSWQQHIPHNPFQCECPPGLYTCMWRCNWRKASSSKAKQPGHSWTCMHNLWIIPGTIEALHVFIDWLQTKGKKYTSGPRYWSIPVLVNTGTFLVYQYCPKNVIFTSLERAGGIQKQTILECQNGLVLPNTRVPVSGTWSILFLVKSHDLLLRAIFTS